MPYAINDGIRIHYEVMGDGPPLILQHGFCGSGYDWIEFGYTEALRDRYRLILVDARGHGDSDKPHDPHMYALDRRIDDILAVVDDLGIDKAHYLGYSMGGWIGYGMAKYAPARASSLMIGGAQPYGRTFVDGRKILAEGMDSWTEHANTWGDHYSPQMLARIRRNDPDAMLAALHDRADISQILPSMSMPTLLFAGDADVEFSTIARAAREIPLAEFVSILGANHIQAYQRSYLITPHLLSFLQKVV